jgi:hypothetical protein
MLFLDGHVEGLRPARNSLASWWSKAGVDLLERSNVHDIDTGDGLFNGSGPSGNP